jgi:hypothetical protein
MGYTHLITFYKKVDGLGWMYSDFKTTQDALRLQLRGLYKKQAKGVVRAINYAKLT